MIYTFSVNRKALTFNSAYPTNKMGRRFLTREGKEFKEEVFYEVKKQCPGFQLKEKHVLCVEYFFYSKAVVTKKGTVSKTAGDLDGQIKLLQDAMCDALGLDDSIIFEINAKKILSSKDSITVIFRMALMDSFKAAVP